MEATDTPKFIAEIDGITQLPIDGISLAYSFDNGAAHSARTEQYYEQLGNRALYKDGWKAVTLHGNRMPWVAAGTFPFDKDVWEPYNLNRTSPNPTTWRKKIQPNSGAQRNGMPRPGKTTCIPSTTMLTAGLLSNSVVLFGDRKSFIYYAPGAQRIPEAVSAPTKNTSHTIETTLDLRGDEAGVIVACGGVNGGYTLFIADHKLHYDYNYFNSIAIAWCRLFSRPVRSISNLTS